MSIARDDLTYWQALEVDYRVGKALAKDITVVSADQWKTETAFFFLPKETPMAKIDVRLIGSPSEPHRNLIRCYIVCRA